jgi:hypothetical protein
MGERASFFVFRGRIRFKFEVSSFSCSFLLLVFLVVSVVGGLVAEFGSDLVSGL